MESEHMKDNIRKYLNFGIWLLLHVLCIYPGVYYAICQSYHSPISIWAHIAFLLMSLFYTVYTFLLAWYKKGNPDSKKLYRIRDLAYHYRKLYAEEFKLNIYDVTDERQSGSRRH